MKFIFRIEDWLVKGEKALVVSFIALMIIFSFLQLSLRIVFNSGIVWLDPALRHMVLWTGLTGAVLAPTDRDPADAAALKVIGRAFPKHEIVGIDCTPLIWQHGSLHCVTMQIPRGVLGAEPANPASTAP